METSWLEAVGDSFSDPSVGLVGGKNLPEYDVSPPPWMEGLWDHTPWGKALGYYSVLDFGDEIREIPPEYVCGCNFSIRREILERAGGGHPDGMPDHLIKYRGDGETAVARAAASLGYKALYHPKASVHHLIPANRMTFEYLYKRCFAQGISDSYTLIRRNGGSILRAEMTLLWRRIKSALDSLLKGDDPEAYEARNAIRRGYRDGVAFHSREVKNDPELLGWILKKDYRE